MIIARKLRASHLEYPLCLCGLPMRLSRIEPHPVLEHTESIVFECTGCGHTLTQMRAIEDSESVEGISIVPRLSA